MSDTVLEPLDTSIFDSEKPCIFSHGDLVPENIIIHDGHISGIIDWKWAGWYPYFWNAFIAQRRCPLYPVKTWTCWMEMVRHSMDTHDREWREFLWIYETASTYVGS
ncbi:hypothetical protein BT96DRAFT_912797 [Gymnopus androsaceus JB14]|uniref:Aminoglycoside phosphotransferase domain-containing protein n=1 Tax=Gymnopus androsaceus JB14 TaxID=1447944 RepID=A0A6A4IJQ9_9AGAR|nr:hypothetical protein BT96DRAFT_912797 [Gymnopus androsaceus JB14]